MFILICYNNDMAEYKVPQNVEADDKLIGPFSFRQFCYLMIAFGGCVMAFFLGKQALPLAIIPAPAVILFGVLALPLRKDQPMEIYLAALVRYYILKPKVRIWIADGEEPNVKIGAPVSEDDIKTKDLKAEEVSQRLSFLANLTDTQGWSTRGLDAPRVNHNLNEDFMASTADARDIMDENDSNAENIDRLLDKSAKSVRSNAIQKMRDLVKKNNRNNKNSAAPAPAATPVPMQMPVQPVMPYMPPRPTLPVAPLPNYNYQMPTTPAQPVAPVALNGVQLADNLTEATIAPKVAAPVVPEVKPVVTPAPAVTPNKQDILPNKPDSAIIKLDAASSSSDDDMIDIKLH